MSAKSSREGNARSNEFLLRAFLRAHRAFAVVFPFFHPTPTQTSVDPPPAPPRVGLRPGCRRRAGDRLFLRRETDDVAPRPATSTRGHPWRTPPFPPSRGRAPRPPRRPRRG